MGEFMCDSESVSQTRDGSSFVSEITRKQIGRVLVLMYGVIRVFTIVSLVLLILAGIFKWKSTEFIGCIFMASLTLSVIVGRSRRFYYTKTNWLEYFTELTFVLGILFLLLSFILDIKKFVVLLVLFGLFTFVISPILGIIRRAILIARKKAESIRNTITEIIILSIPVIIVTWILLKYILF